MVRSLLLILSLAASTPALAGLADVEVYDRTAGRTLTVHEHHGRRYIVGEPGHEYELRLHNRTGARVLAVTSVDGVNVVSGETAAPDQGGYVLGPYDRLGIAGWRKSLDEIAAFFFTRHRNSYAARTGRPFDVGVIGVALFREKARCCEGFGWGDERQDEDRAASAPEPSLRQREEKLGTGHGRREHSAARYTEFERAGDAPDEIVAIYYDSRENLIAQGVIPRHRDYALRPPRPFPGSFVPDP
jgi:hypothetical protein